MRWDIALSSAAIAVSLIAIGTVLGVSTPGRVQQGIEIGNPESDPRPGLVLEKPLRDLNGQVVNQESLFLVYAGDCVGCAVNSVTDDKLPHKDYKVVAVAFSGTSKEVAKVKIKFKRARLIADENFILHSALNPRWPARWYAFDNGKLSRFQRSPDEKP